MECLVNWPYSDILARKVECIGQADIHDCRFARLAGKPAHLANRSEQICGRTQGRRRSSSRYSKTFLGFSTFNERWPVQSLDITPLPISFPSGPQPYAVSSVFFASNLSLPKPKSTSCQPLNSRDGMACLHK